MVLPFTFMIAIHDKAIHAIQQGPFMMAFTPPFMIAFMMSFIVTFMMSFIVTFFLVNGFDWWP